MVAARQARNEAERQADAASIKMRRQQRRARAEQNVAARQEHSRLKAHARRVDVYKRKEQAHRAALQRAEANFELPPGIVKQTRRSRDPSSTARASSASIEDSKLRQDNGDNSSARMLPTSHGDALSTTGEECENDSSPTLIEEPAASLTPPRHNPDEQGTIVGIPSCLKV